MKPHDMSSLNTVAVQLRQLLNIWRNVHIVMNALLAQPS